MSFNLIDSVRGLLGADLVPKASARLHDDETRIQYAMSAIVPAVLAVLSIKPVPAMPAEFLQWQKIQRMVMCSRM